MLLVVVLAVRSLHWGATTAAAVAAKPSQLPQQFPIDTNVGRKDGCEIATAFPFL